jgi:hypothetical protein
VSSWVPCGRARRCCGFDLSKASKPLRPLANGARGECEVGSGSSAQANARGRPGLERQTRPGGGRGAKGERARGAYRGGPTQDFWRRRPMARAGARMHTLEIGERIDWSLTGGSKRCGAVLAYRVGSGLRVRSVKKKEFIFF